MPDRASSNNRSSFSQPRNRCADPLTTTSPHGTPEPGSKRSVRSIRSDTPSPSQHVERLASVSAPELIWNQRSGPNPARPIVPGRTLPRKRGSTKGVQRYDDQPLHSSRYVRVEGVLGAVTAVTLLGAASAQARGSRSAVCVSRIQPRLQRDDGLWKRSRPAARGIHHLHRQDGDDRVTASALRAHRDLHAWKLLSRGHPDRACHPPDNGRRTRVVGAATSRRTAFGLRAENGSRPRASAESESPSPRWATAS